MRRHGRGRVPSWMIVYPGTLLALCLVTSGALARQPVQPEPAAIDAFIRDQMAANRVPGLALAITRGDDVFYLQGYGTAGDDRRVTPRTQFFTGSLSKSFTALAVMQLAEAGRVDLDRPVRDYLPDFIAADPDAAGRVTVRHLLNQTSGFADAGFPSYRRPQPKTLAERVTSLANARLVSEPGTVYHYWNPNYELLARIVEVVSGEPFNDYLRRHIFEPLGMRDTVSVVTSDEADEAAPDLAQGYILAFGIRIPRDELDGFLAGSGGVISTAQDMANDLIMQGNGGRFDDRTLASEPSVELMHTPPPDIDSPYAMGWLVPDADARPRVIEHNGVLSVFHADAVLLPDEGYGFALLYNESYTLTNYEGIKQGLIDLLTGQPPNAGGVSGGVIALIVAVLALVTITLQVRGILRLPVWAARSRQRSIWRLLPGIVWRFVPAVLFGLMPTLVAVFSGRAFTLGQLFRAMPDIMLWLAISGILGIVAGVLRLGILARRAGAATPTVAPGPKEP